MVSDRLSVGRRQKSAQKTVDCEAGHRGASLCHEPAARGNQGRRQRRNRSKRGTGARGPGRVPPSARGLRKSGRRSAVPGASVGGRRRSGWPGAVGGLSGDVPPQTRWREPRLQVPARTFIPPSRRLPGWRRRQAVRIIETILRTRENHACFKVDFLGDFSSRYFKEGCRDIPGMTRKPAIKL